jgi:hypothetical protein
VSAWIKTPYHDRKRPVLLSDWPETHRQGELRIENPDIIAEMDLSNCDLGVQIAWDGRVWLCVNGVAWVRFKPSRNDEAGTMPLSNEGGEQHEEVDQAGADRLDSPGDLQQPR